MSDNIKKVKIAATRVGFNKMPDSINPDRPDKNINIGEIKKYAEGNVERTVAALRQAGEQGADIALTHEDIKSMGQYARNEIKNIFAEISEEIPGPTSEKLSAVAREYNMHVAACFYEKENGRFYNSAVLIGRKGEIIGKYRKVHLPRLEQWLITPGKETPVFATDVGNIGVAICYDIAFPEHCRSLALNGADIILHPTVGWGFVYGEKASMGEALNRVRAAENQCYLACAINIPGGKSCVISNDGTILGENGDIDNNIEKDGIAIAEFAPDYNLVKPESYWSFLANVPSIRARMAFERQPGAYGAITQDTPDIIKRYADCEFSHNGSRIAEQIGEQWDMWRQGKIKLEYTWD